MASSKVSKVTTLRNLGYSKIRKMLNLFFNPLKPIN